MAQVLNQQHHATISHPPRSETHNSVAVPATIPCRYPRLHLFVGGPKLKTFLSLLAAATKVADSIFLEPSHNAFVLRAVPNNKAAHFLVVLDPAVALDGYQLNLPTLERNNEAVNHNAAAQMPPPVSYQPLHLRLQSKAVAATLLRHPTSVSRIDLYYDGTPSAVPAAVAAMVGSNGGSAAANGGGSPFGSYGGDKMVATTSTNANLRRTFTLNLQEGAPEKASVDAKLFRFECVAEPKLWAAYVGSLGSGATSNAGGSASSSKSSSSNITVFPQGTRLLFRASMTLAELGAYASGENGASTSQHGARPSTLGPVVSVDAAQFSVFNWSNRDNETNPAPTSANASQLYQSQMIATTPGKTVDARPLKLFYHLCEVLGMRTRSRFGGPNVPLFLDGLPREAHVAPMVRHVSLLLAATDCSQQHPGQQAGQIVHQPQEQAQPPQQLQNQQPQPHTTADAQRAQSMPIANLHAHSPTTAQQPISILKRSSMMLADTPMGGGGRGSEANRAFHPPPPLGGESIIRNSTSFAGDRENQDDADVEGYPDSSADTLAGPSAFPHNTGANAMTGGNQVLAGPSGFPQIAGPTDRSPPQQAVASQRSFVGPSGPLHASSSVGTHPQIAGLVSLSFGSPMAANSTIGSKRAREETEEEEGTVERHSGILARPSVGGQMSGRSPPHQNFSQGSSVVAGTVYGDGDVHEDLDDNDNEVLAGKSLARPSSSRRGSGGVDDDEVVCATARSSTKSLSVVHSQVVAPSGAPAAAPQNTITGGVFGVASPLQATATSQKASQFESIIAGLVGPVVRSPTSAKATSPPLPQPNPTRYTNTAESPYDPNAETLAPMWTAGGTYNANDHNRGAPQIPLQAPPHSFTPDRSGDSRDSVEEFVPASDEKQYPPRNASGVMASASEYHRSASRVDPSNPHVRTTPFQQEWGANEVVPATASGSVFSPSSSPKQSASVQLSGGTVVVTGGSEPPQFISSDQQRSNSTPEQLAHRALLEQYSQFIVSSDDDEEDTLTNRFVQGALSGAGGH